MNRKRLIPALALSATFVLLPAAAMADHADPPFMQTPKADAAQAPRTVAAGTAAPAARNAPAGNLASAARAAPAPMAKQWAREPSSRQITDKLAVENNRAFGRIGTP